MELTRILQLLKNSGFHVLGVEGNFIALEDPACFLRGISEFMDLAWIAIGVITAFLLLGWAISMIRGADIKIMDNLRNLTLIFGILAVAKPMVNLIWGDDLFQSGCRTILIPVDQVHNLLATRDAVLKGHFAENPEMLDIWDSRSGQEYLDAMQNVDLNMTLGTEMDLSGAGPTRTALKSVSGIQVVGTDAFTRSATRANNHTVLRATTALNANDLQSAREIIARNNLRMRGFDRAGGGGVGDRRRDARYSSGYRDHEGLDISTAVGTSVPALFSGTVASIKPMHNGLWSMTIRNENGTTSFMGYVQKAEGINVGTRVRAGATIGYSQNIAVAPQYRNVPNHVHYELWDGNKGGGNIIDPADLF